jgi:hypothetical protein
MTVSIEISADAEELLRSAFGSNLSRAALEAMVIEGFRSGKLSRFQAQTVLDFDNRWETEEWLGAHGAESSYSMEDLEADRQTLERILGPSKS